MDRLAKIPGQKIYGTTFEKKIDTMDRLAKIQARILLKQRLDFPFENKIETMDRLPKIQCKNIVETTVRFFI